MHTQCLQSLEKIGGFLASALATSDVVISIREEAHERIEASLRRFNYLTFSKAHKGVDRD